MNPVVHFELPYKDRERIARFYSAVFGWKLEMLGPEMGNYVLATTALPEKAPAAPPHAVPGCINGGFHPHNPEWPAQYPSVVIGVEDIRQAMGKVREARGEVLGDPMDIPGVGSYVSFFDTEGNRISMLQPLPMGG